MSEQVQIFEGEYDEEGVYFYQAYHDEIADWALEHQTLGGPKFNPKRMTWIKPSFAWMLYRSGYGMKKGQNRILKIKVPHETVAEILEQCSCHSAGGGFGRVQWDPARDLFSAQDRKPTKLLRRRAIQIGVAGPLSELYVSSILSIEEVTPLANQVGIAHSVLIQRGEHIIKNKKRSHKSDLLQNPEFLAQLPNEKAYLPKCDEKTLQRLGMLPGKIAEKIAGLGRGGTKIDPGIN